MIIANERRTEYKGYTIVVVPMQTVWGYRLEKEGKVITSRPNGASDPFAAETLAREVIDLGIKAAQI